LGELLRCGVALVCPSKLSQKRRPDRILKLIELKLCSRVPVLAWPLK
jgi:hypothetical protein